MIYSAKELYSMVDGMAGGCETGEFADRRDRQ
jgi:hypothetical protein